MAQSEQRRMLHVANGSSTTGLIEAAGIPGARSLWADPLYEGPVPGGLNDQELLEVRARYLAGPGGQADVAPVNDLRNWRGVLERHQEFEELVLWFEHDLFDQLNLIQLLTWIRERLPPAKRVTLVCIGSFPGHPLFKGLGELSAGELGSLLGTRQPVSDEQYALAQRAWQAFREPTPEPLDALRRTNTSALPYLARSLERFLQEYPWTAGGLSRTERRLLELASDGPVDLARAFPRMHDGEDAYYVTDLSLAGLAESLSRTSPPLLTLAPGRDPARVLHKSVTLTAFGRAVLAGEEDRIAACGMDRWLGGVHLRSGADGWRWDDPRRQITKG